jgi:hypothetical protein
MKKFLLLMMVLTLTAMSAAARPKTSSLTIKGNNNELVSVAIGNLPFSEAAPEVTIKNLQKGKHYIRVMRHHRGLFRSRTEVAYEGYVEIGRKREVVAVVNSNGNLVILHNDKVKKNKPYYEVEPRPGRKSPFMVNIQMDKISVF